MSRPKFSVVIPTRERAHTLGATLRTCLDQNFDDYEIVVCDNCSSPATKEVVDAFSSPRIVYHRSPVALCMGDNWNLAYSLTSGQYVIYIGDDDGLMPFAFSQLNALFERYQASAIRWECAIYSWPNVARSDLADYLQICLKRELSELGGRETIRSVLEGGAPGTHLPNIYHGAIARTALEDIRQKAGRVFGSYHCDTYSSFAAAYLLDRHLSVSAPMSVSGFSNSSNNVAFNFLRRKHANAQNYRAENIGSGVRMHSSLPDLPTGLIVTAESFLAVKGDLFPDDSNLTLDRKNLVERLLQRMPIDDLDEWPEAVAEIRRSLSDDASLGAWFEERLKTVEPKVTPPDSFRAPIEGVWAGYLHLDSSRLGVQDVADATRLAARILGYGVRPIVWEPGPFEETGTLRRRFADWRLKAILALQRRSRREREKKLAAAT